MNKQVVQSWEQALHTLHGRIGQHFKRAEPRERAYRYVQGLLSDIPRKNGWQLAEQTGEARPDGMQRLLSEAVWDEDGGCVCEAMWSSTSGRQTVYWS